MVCLPLWRVLAALSKGSQEGVSEDWMVSLSVPGGSSANLGLSGCFAEVPGGGDFVSLLDTSFCLVFFPFFSGDFCDWKS